MKNRSLFVNVLAIVTVLLFVTGVFACNGNKCGGNATATAVGVGIGIGIGGQGGNATVNNTNKNVSKNKNTNVNLNANMNKNVNKNVNKNTNVNVNKNQQGQLQGQVQGQKQSQGQNQGQSQSVNNSGNTAQTTGDIAITFEDKRELLATPSAVASVVEAIDPHQTYQGRVDIAMMDLALTWKEAKNMKPRHSLRIPGLSLPKIESVFRAKSRKDFRDKDRALTAKFLPVEAGIEGKRLGSGWEYAPDIGGAQANVAIKAMKVGHESKKTVTVYFVLEQVPVGKVRGLGGFVSPGTSKNYKTSGVSASGGAAVNSTDSRSDLYYKITYVVTELS